MVAREVVPPGEGGDAVPATDVDVDAADTEASAEVMQLLSQHVPLALLADLAIPTGPESPQILQDEGLPDTAWWESAEPVDEHEDAAGASLAP